MSKRRDSYRATHSQIVASSGTGTIKGDRVKPGQLLVCQSISFMNESGARGSAVLKIDDSGVDTVLDEQQTPAAAVWYSYDTPQYLREGECIKVDQASCSTSDVLDLQVVGYREYPDG